MNDEIINTVLNEILQEQKAFNNQKQKDSEVHQQLLAKIQNLEDSIHELKAALPTTQPEPVNISGLQQAIIGGVEKLRKIIEAQPKVITLNKRVLLFPEGRAEQYYQIIFGGLLKGIAILIIGIFTLNMIGRFIHEKEYLPYKRAWQMLYNNQKEDGKQLLERIWNDCTEEEVEKEKAPLNSKFTGGKK